MFDVIPPVSPSPSRSPAPEVPAPRNQGEQKPSIQMSDWAPGAEARLRRAEVSGALSFAMWSPRRSRRDTSLLKGEFAIAAPPVRLTIKEEHPS
jgi:hypothetical protein